MKKNTYNKGGVQVGDAKREYVLAHLAEAKRNPEELARAMKAAGLYARSTAVSDIVRLIHRVLRENQ